MAAVAGLAALCGPPSARGHVDDPLLPEECGSCHVGHGMSGQPLLDLAEEDFCYQCHGSPEKRSVMVAAGRLSPAARPADVEREFEKPFHHPVKAGAGHAPDEKLPAFGGGAVGHAECVDCHEPHRRRLAGRVGMRDVAGYSLSGQYLETSMSEYEICLKCHADRAGFDRSEHRLQEEFALDGRSQHPVTRSARGEKLPSLNRVVGQGASMRCSDCHTSDDSSAPRGPHGSSYRFLLSGNYLLDPVAEESALAYEFCYSCHDRASILADDSFPLHRLHIEGDPLAGRPGTSCYTCHASHGSPKYPHLLRFHPGAVSRDPGTGLVRYVQTAPGSGQCWLSCHGVDHGPEDY